MKHLDPIQVSEYQGKPVLLTQYEREAVDEPVPNSYLIMGNRRLNLDNLTPTAVRYLPFAYAYARGTSWGQLIAFAISAGLWEPIPAPAEPVERICPKCYHRGEPEGKLRADGIHSVCENCGEELGETGTVLGGKYHYEGPYTKEAGKIAYKLVGLRGAEYRLMRMVGNPQLMFVLDRKGTTVALRGNTIFTDRDGYLRAFA